MTRTYLHHHRRRSSKERNLFLSILLNSVITVSQVIGGILSGSLALLSDALHNFTDVLTLIISYIAHLLSKKRASTNRTFGFKRAEIMAAFINSATLIVIAILLIIASLKRFVHPQEIKSNLVIWLSLLGIVANGLSVFLLKKDADKNINIHSAYLHLVTDTLASVAVLIGGLAMKYYKIYQIDSVLTFLIAAYLVVVGYDLLKKSTEMLMLFTPQNIDIKEVARVVQKIPEVNKLHHIHIWRLSDDELHLEAHLDFKEDLSISEFTRILDGVEAVLYQNFQINHVNIQPEFEKEDSKDLIVQD
jgi:cobalt-zinc-cadmium efflux system protein